jgi:hypothetical protein
MEPEALVVAALMPQLPLESDAGHVIGAVHDGVGIPAIPADHDI